MAREGVKLEVISEGKDSRGRVVKRQVVETWEETKGRRVSRTFHEKKTVGGGWSRVKPNAKEGKAKSKIKKGNK